MSSYLDNWKKLEDKWKLSLSEEFKNRLMKENECECGHGMLRHGRGSDSCYGLTEENVPVGIADTPRSMDLGNPLCKCVMYEEGGLFVEVKRVRSED